MGRGGKNEARVKRLDFLLGVIITLLNEMRILFSIVVLCSQMKVGTALLNERRILFSIAVLYSQMKVGTALLNKMHFYSVLLCFVLK